MGCVTDYVPADYTAFRNDLGQSSGFQSYQYRMIEFVMGNRNPNMMAPHSHVPAVYKMLSDELARPSFYDEVVRYLFITLDKHEANLPMPQLTTPHTCLLYTSPSPRDATLSRMPSSA